MGNSGTFSMDKEHSLSDEETLGKQFGKYDAESTLLYT